MLNDWWRGAVIYQIYPRSFCDSNQDGIGDLPGIAEKLPYIASLGVDAIWVSPFLRSPQRDFGYDVSDYYQIDPLFGTLEDFDHLIKAAHDLGLKIIMDLVLNHTSIEHSWFQQSRQNKTNPKANWYVWTDAKADAGPPNNWLSVFGGSAWEWDEQRQQYYLHNFLTSQPDLNFHHPEVLEEMLKVMQFWLERGVSGFRLDAVNYYWHDALLRDNPLRPENICGAEGVPATNPYARQYHRYDKTQVENLIVLKKIRQVLNQYPDAMAMGEVGDDNSMLTSAIYADGTEHLHTAYTFKLLDVSDEFSARWMAEMIQEVEKHMPNSWPCWALSNHDVPRVVTRFSRGKPSAAFSKVLMAMLLCLRGTVCLYQGEELGLEEAEVPYECMQDPYGLRFYPEFKGRDGCRTPIPWHHSQEDAQVKSWLPMYKPHLQQAVDLQQADENSVLTAYQTFLHWRKKFPALLVGAIQVLFADEALLVFKRFLKDESILIVLNLSNKEQTYFFSLGCYEQLEGSGFSANVMISQVHLPAYGAFFGKEK